MHGMGYTTTCAIDYREKNGRSELPKVSRGSSIRLVLVDTRKILFTYFDIVRHRLEILDFLVRSSP
jgi:hypothetical protein